MHIGRGSPAPQYSPLYPPPGLLPWTGVVVSVCREGLGSPVTALPPRPAVSRCSSARAGSCLSLKSSTGPRQPSLLMRGSHYR